MFSNISEPFWNLAPSRTQNVNFRGDSKAPTFLLVKISTRRHLRWINLKLFGITFYYAHNLPKCFAFEKSVIWSLCFPRENFGLKSWQRCRFLGLILVCQTSVHKRCHLKLLGKCPGSGKESQSTVVSFKKPF